MEGGGEQGQNYRVFLYFFYFCCIFQIGYEDEVESDIFFIKEVSFQVIGDFEWRDINYIFNIDFLDWVSVG